MHDIERVEVDGQKVYSMAYSGDVPWHGLGQQVSNDLTPKQMLKAANLDWKVVKPLLQSRLHHEFVESRL